MSMTVSHSLSIWLPVSTWNTCASFFFFLIACEKELQIHNENKEYSLRTFGKILITVCYTSF